MYTKPASCGRAVEVPWVCATQCEMFYCGHTSHLCVRVDVQHSYSCTVWNLQIQHVDTRVGPVRKVSKRGESQRAFVSSRFRPRLGLSFKRNRRS